MERYTIDELHQSINDIYEQLDEGRMTMQEADELAHRCCLAFIKSPPIPPYETA
jgi:hypothetical protein